MSGLDPGSITPADAVVALRSYPRRWKGAFAVVEDEDEGDALLKRGDPSALDLLGHSVSALRAADGWLRTILVDDRPELAPPADVAAQSVDDLEAAADALTRTVESVPPDDWYRAGVTDGAETTALDVVRNAVVTVSDDLRQAERTLREQVGRPDESA